jgi:DNA-nicking Smr family endonuclease
MEVDLHGMHHNEAILKLEDICLRESMNFGWQVIAITGNSKKLQAKIIKDIINKWELNYHIPTYNLGQIIITG